jgi:phenylacetate-CoA ligase
MNILTLLKTRLEHVRNARRSPEEIKARQLTKFRRLALHAARHSPYYGDLIKKHGIDVDTCVPPDFPVLTKSEMMANFDRIVTDRRITRDGITDFLSSSKDPFDLYKKEFYVVHTSGTSGELGLFVYSQADWTRGAAHALRINPVRPGKRRLAFFAATGGHFAGASLAATCRRSLLKLKYDVEMYEINSPLAPVLESIDAFKPDILMGYSSAIAILAERQQRGEINIAPKWIQSSGEPVSAANREIIETTFGVPVINVYVCTEHMIMGYSLPDFGGMYLFEDDLIFELEPDHTLVTNLFNRTLPLIRYYMSDVLVPLDGRGPHLPFTKVKELAGRSEHIPVFTNRHGDDDFISPFIIVEFLVRNVRRFQLQVIDKSNCVFRVCLEDGLGDDARAETLENVKARLGDIFAEKEMTNVAIDVEAVDELSVDPKTGKFRLIVPAEAAKGENNR